MPRPLRVSKKLTRKEMIDTSTGSAHRPQLEQAGWYLRDHAEEQAKVFDYAT